MQNNKNFILSKLAEKVMVGVDANPQSHVDVVNQYISRLREISEHLTKTSKEFDEIWGNLLRAGLVSETLEFNTFINELNMAITNLASEAQQQIEEENAPLEEDGGQNE